MDTNNSNKTHSTFTSSAFLDAHKAVLEALNKPIVIHPDFEVLPPPRYEGERITGVYEYIATRASGYLAWEKVSAPASEI